MVAARAWSDFNSLACRWHIMIGLSLSAAATEAHRDCRAADSDSEREAAPSQDRGVTEIKVHHDHLLMRSDSGRDSESGSVYSGIIGSGSPQSLQSRNSGARSGPAAAAAGWCEATPGGGPPALLRDSSTATVAGPGPDPGPDSESAGAQADCY